MRVKFRMFDNSAIDQTDLSQIFIIINLSHEDIVLNISKQ